MKKVFLTAIIAAAFAFGMTSCNNNAAETETDTTAQVEACEGAAGECANHVEGCAEGDCDNCPHQGTDECCKANGAEGCEHAQAAGQCENAGQCEHAGAGHCEKAAQAETK